MTDVRPLINDNNNLREMTDSEKVNMVTYCAELYRNNPTVTLSVVGSGGNLGSFDDTRLTAGEVLIGSGDFPIPSGNISPSDPRAQNNGAEEFPSEDSTQEPQVLAVAFSRLEQTIDSSGLADSDTDSKKFPVYYDGDNIKSMTLTDMYDTFIKDAISEVAPDIYYIHNDSALAGYSLVDTTPIFIDTGADVAQYTAAAIPEDADQPYVREQFYLHQKDFTLRDSAFPPVRVQTGASDNLRTLLDSDWRVMLETSMRYASVNLSGSIIKYGINTGGTDCGAFYDDRLNGTGNYQTLFVGPDEYRAQEFPDGSFIRINTYTLQSRLDT